MNHCPLGEMVFCCFQVSTVIASHSAASGDSHGESGERVLAIESSLANGMWASASSGPSAREPSGPPAGVSDRPPM